MKKAIVTGAGGQDGYYMAALLADKGYNVTGIVHRDDGTNDLKDRINIRELDISDHHAVYELIREIKPDEVYNYAAQSSSIYSWDDTLETCELNFMSVAAILQGIRDHSPECRFFQASSAEIFGRDPVETPQRADTRPHPITPYATAKTASGMLISNYREHYGIFAVSGIFYNHESVRRKQSFLPAKITRTVADIKKGIVDCLYVGNINSERDWGYAPDYMEAAWRTLQLEKADDYVFATGIVHSVREMIEEAFRAVEMPIIWQGEGTDEIGITTDTGRTVVQIDPQFYRSYDRNNSVGDPSKLYEAIQWTPPTSFRDMITDMTQYFVEYGSN